MTRTVLLSCAPWATILVLMIPAKVEAQDSFEITDVLSPGFPYSLVAADNVDRIAWIEYERGMRNVYTAVPPAYAPTRLTNYLEDDGIDLQSLQISDDGEIVTFLRGHAPSLRNWPRRPSRRPASPSRAKRRCGASRLRST